MAELTPREHALKAIEAGESVVVDGIQYTKANVTDLPNEEAFMGADEDIDALLSKIDESIDKLNTRKTALQEKKSAQVSKAEPKEAKAEEKPAKAEEPKVSEKSK